MTAILMALLGSGSGSVNAQVLGVSASAFVGTVGEQGSSSVAVSGVVANGSVGNVLLPNETVALTGVSAQGNAGFATTQGSVTFGLVGVSASGAVGGVQTSTVISVSTTVTGVSASALVRPVATTAGARTFPTGVSASALVRPVAIGAGVSTAVTGVAASGGVGSVQAGQFFAIPEGAIFLFDRSSEGTAIPSGFSLYTEENGESVTGFLIKGGSAVSRDTGTSAEINISYPGETVTTGPAGSHGFGVANIPNGSLGAQFSSSPSNTTANYDADAGAHTHTLSITGSGVIPNTYPASATTQGTSVPLIRASAGRDTIPANAIVFGTSSGGFSGFSSKTWSVNGVYSIAASVNVNNPAPTNLSPAITVGTSSNGAHNHFRTVPNGIYVPAPSTPYPTADQIAGNHTHPGGSVGFLGVWKQFKHLLPFVSTGTSQVQSGMIVMFNGVTVPVGWKLCDGTNGTPDMVGYFLGFNSGSSGNTLIGRDVVGSSGPTATTPAPPPSAYGSTSVPVTIAPSPWSHDHSRFRSVERRQPSPAIYHGSGSVSHTHTSPSITFTMPNAYMPRNLTLIFIQKE